MSDALGIPGFTFADLHQPARLRALYELFCDEARRLDPELWAQWEVHRANPGALGHVARSELIVAMAPHVSRFLLRLFSIGPEADALAAETRVYDDVFRFKIDFVRRRALPLLKTGKPVEATAEDHRYVDVVLRGLDTDAARELALSRVGCALLDREEAARAAGTDDEKQAVATEIESLKRWCAAHVNDPRYRGWVVFRFPKTLDPMHLVHVDRPDRQAPGVDGRTRARAAASRRLHVDRPAIHQARDPQRDSLLCVVPRA